MPCVPKSSLVHGGRDRPNLEADVIKNLSSTHLLLVAIAAVLLLVAAFSFYLLQDPSATLPFSAPPATSTPSFTAPTLTIQPSETSTPTRHTTYTPFATRYTPTSTGNPPVTIAPTTQIVPGPTTTPSRTFSITVTPTTSSITPSPTITQTLSLGETGVTGRIVLNGTPVANAVVEFKDDVAARRSSTNQSGHYWFTTLAPGTAFSLTFNQSVNPQMTPAASLTSLAWIEGTLPLGVNPIDMPDFEISINLNGMLYSLESPVDGATYSASHINDSSPIPFVWSIYNLGGSYHIELGPNGSTQPSWTSSELSSTHYMWDGTLDNGNHIAQGAYWWRVAAKRSLSNYVIVISTQPWDIVFNP